MSIGIDIHKLKTLVHGFLGHQWLNISLKGHNGQSYKPREWSHGNHQQSVFGQALDKIIGTF
jgi:hypothetical protein